MSKLLAFLGLFALIMAVSAMHDSNLLHDHELFEHFKMAHNKQYKDAAEHDFRLHAFRNTLRRIEKYNAESTGATFGVNQFSDWTEEELEATYSRPTENIDELYNAVPIVELDNNKLTAVTAYDWRSVTGKVTAVKNQGQCGSCYAFSAAAALESRKAIVKGVTALSLSPQQVVDCDTVDSGCNGGFYTNVWSYVVQAGGQDSFTGYPYTGVKGTCAYNAATAIAAVSASNPYFRPSSTTPSTLTGYLVSYGPFSAALYVQSDLYSYTSGVYRPSGCTSAINHAITVVGFGTDSVGIYYIVKNSWGTSWGQSGYFLIGANSCSISNYWATPNPA